MKSSGRGGTPKSRKRRFIKRDKEGVASTVGTIMALLVFLAFLGIFTTTYIPVWMLDNERAHMNEAINEFGELKGRIDSLIIVHQTTGTSNIDVFAPITLGSEGVPVFASPTIGEIGYTPAGTGNYTGMNIKFNYTVSTPGGSERIQVDNDGGGRLELYAPNRYYVQQWLAYENGAIIIKQLDGQVMRGFPSIDVEKATGGNVSLDFTQIDFIGINTTIAGTGTVGVNMGLEYLDSQEFEFDDAESVVITFRTEYYEAWLEFFVEMCEEGGLANDTDYRLTDMEISDGVHEIQFVILDCSSMSYNRAYLTATMQR